MRGWWRRQDQDEVVQERSRRDLEGGGRSTALRRLYWVLGVTIVTAITVVMLYPGHDMVDRFGANIATEAAAILVTLVFVHRFLQQQDRDRRLRASIGALRRASRGLTRLSSVWVALLRGTLGNTGMERPRAAPALFRPTVTECLGYLDPGARRGVDGADDTWVHWASQEISAALTMLHDIVVAYGASLDPAYVEAVDDLIDDPFLRTFTELVETGADARTWRSRMNAARAAREVHFARLVRLLDLHNDLAHMAGRVRAASSAPRTGVLGFNLEPDADLRVITRIAQEQWESAPLPGALRSDQSRVS